MRLAYIQFNPAFNDLDETLRRLEPLLEEVTAADLVVLPELCNSGYAFSSIQEARTTCEPVGNGPFQDFLAAWCAENQSHIVAGLNELEGNRLFNSSVLVSPQGVKAHYRKLHLFLNEKQWFTPGDIHPEPTEVGSAAVAMLICFDWQFPEIWRVLALKGADIICHPSNLVLPGQAQQAIPVHARINRYFIITANRIGTEGDLRFTGRSIIVQPSGAVLAEAPQAENHVAVVEVDPADARNKQVTRRNHLLADRRPVFYKHLVD